jgi:hypothetical protein
MPEFDSTARYLSIIDFPGYSVGSDGSIWSQWEQTSPYKNGRCAGATYILGKWRRLKLQPNTLGYPTVSLRKNGRQSRIMVHLLVLTAFVGPRPPGLIGLHDNDINTDNRLDNLSWGTVQKNWEDRKRNGGARSPKGEAHGMAKITMEQALEIKRRRDSGEKLKVIAREYGISMTAVCALVKGRNWAGALASQS